MLNKKGISPVVATALLLVVAVVAAVSFQTWFNNYSGGLFSKAETQSSNGSMVTIIDTIEDNTIYFKNGYNNLTINKVTVNGTNCYVSGTYTSSYNTIYMSNCTTNGENKVSVFTNNGIYSKSVYKQYQNYVNPCPTGYILVPGNSDLGTRNFCVMKYEAKNVANVATSQAALTPWVGATLTSARNNCSILGSKYHLITNAEWTTIARNVELVGGNWNTSTVGNGFMFSGHNDNNPANSLAAETNDSNGYYLTADNLSSCDGVFFGGFVAGDDVVTGRACAGQKRTFILSNGEVIWDLSGNIYERNNDTCSQGDPWYTAGTIDWTDANINTIEKLLGGPVGNYDVTNSIGRYNGCAVVGNSFIRSSRWDDGIYAGAFSMTMFVSPGVTGPGYGFRCAYTP